TNDWARLGPKWTTDTLPASTVRSTEPSGFWLRVVTTEGPKPGGGGKVLKSIGLTTGKRFMSKSTVGGGATSAAAGGTSRARMITTAASSRIEQRNSRRTTRGVKNTARPATRLSSALARGRYAASV